MFYCFIDGAKREFQLRHVGQNMTRTCTIMNLPRNIECEPVRSLCVFVLIDHSVIITEIVERITIRFTMTCIDRHLASHIKMFFRQSTASLPQEERAKYFSSMG